MSKQRTQHNEPFKGLTHRYHRIALQNGSMIWSCSLPECNHYIPKQLTVTIEGKYSYCWECNNKFILDAEALNEDMPRCIDCRYNVSEELVNLLSNENKG